MTVIDLKKSVLKITLRPNDFDSDKILNNSVYLQLAEMGRWDFLTINKLNINNDEITTVVSDLTIQYLCPIVWEPNKIITVKTNLTSIKEYSVLFSQGIYCEKNKLKSKICVRIAVFDKKKLCLIRIPRSINGK